MGNYVVRALVGKGGWGTVYRAEHPAIRSTVAIKLLRPELCDSEESLSRFFNEARAANAIRSQHIVEVMDFGQTDAGQPYFIMEWLQGQSLGALLKANGALPTERACRIARQIARGLAAAHDAGVIHRDLKPDNVFLQRREEDRDFVKLLDFGIAKIVGDAGVAHRTSTGQTFGTPTYMSPEQAEGMRALDGRSDIYSLGVILYEMLTGLRPFRAEGVGALILQHMQERPVPPRSLAPAVPAVLEALVLRMLEKAPAQRPQAMGEVERALAPDGESVPVPAAGGETATTRLPFGAASATTTEQVTAPPPRAGHRRLWLAAGAVATCAAAAAVVWWPPPSTPIERAPVVSAPPAPPPAPDPAPPPAEPAPAAEPEPAAEAPPAEPPTATRPSRRRAGVRHPAASTRREGVAKPDAPTRRARPPARLDDRPLFLEK